MREELEDVRRRGVAHMSEDAVPSLLAVTRRRRPPTGMPFGEELGRLLAEGVATWGDGAAADAARCTFGLTPRTRLQPGHVRRRAAAEVMGVSAEHFRKTGERDVLDHVAATLVGLGREPMPTVEVPAPRASTGSGEVARVSTLDEEDDYSLRALIEDARTVLVHGKNWVNLFNQQFARLAQVMQRGGTVRVLLVPPDPALAAGVYRASAQASGQILMDNLRTTLDRIADLREQLAESRAEGTLELRFAATVPQYGFIASGPDSSGVDRGLVQIGFAYTRRGSDRFVVCLPHGRALDGFVAEFEAAWAHASTGNDR